MRRALLVALLGLVLLAGCASGRHSSLVPWVNRQLALYQAPDPKVIPYPVTARLCRAAQLRVSQGRGGAATGHELDQLVFTNAGRRTCLLRGYPAISGVTPSGVRRTLRPRHGTFFMPLLPADVAPGRHAFLDVETDDMCRASGAPPSFRYRDLRFSLPWGGVVGGGKLTLTRQCGLAISELGLLERYGPLRARAGTAGTLHAAVDLSTPLRAGAKELDYVVTLSNPTGTDVRLDTCPGYTEAVYSVALQVRRSFSLNCDSVRVIHAHGYARFEMHLALPRPLLAGAAPAKFGWSLDTPNGPYVGRAIPIAKS